MEKYLMFLALCAIPMLIWALLFHASLKSEREWAERNDVKPRLRTKAAIWITLFVIGHGVFWTLAISMIGFVAKSQVASVQSCAKQVYDVAAAYREEFPDAALHSINTSTKEPAAEGSLEERMQVWLYGSYYYAVILDENGNPERAYWSRRPIEESEMKPFDANEQRRIYMSPFIPDDEMVGSWSVYEYRKQQTQKSTTTVR